MNPSRRFGDSGGGLFSTSKSRPSQILPVGLVIVVSVFVSPLILCFYFYF